MKKKKTIGIALIAVGICAIAAAIVYIIFFMDNELQSQYRRQNNAFGVDTNTKAMFAEFNIQEVSTRIRIYNEAENENLTDEEVFDFLSKEFAEEDDEAVQNQPESISKYISWYNDFKTNGKRIVEKNHDSAYEVVKAYNIQNEIFAIEKDSAEICYINTFNSAEYVNQDLLDLMLKVYNKDIEEDGGADADKITVDEVLEYLQEEYDENGQLKVLSRPEKFEKYEIWYTSTSTDGAGKIKSYRDGLLSGEIEEDEE